MDAMEPGECLVLPMTEYYNAQQSAYRLTEAYYGDRRWKCRKLADRVEVEELKRDMRDS